MDGTTYIGLYDSKAAADNGGGDYRSLYSAPSGLPARFRTPAAAMDFKDDNLRDSEGVFYGLVRGS